MEKEIDMEQPTADLIKHALDQDYNKANEIFGDIMGQKINDMLDQEKVKMADQIYNDGGEQMELPLGDENGGEANEEEAEAASEPTADTESGDEEMETGEEESGEDVEVEVGNEEDEEEEVNN